MGQSSPSYPLRVGRDVARVSMARGRRTRVGRPTAPASADRGLSISYHTGQGSGLERLGKGDSPLLRETPLRGAAHKRVPSPFPKRSRRLFAGRLAFLEPERGGGVQFMADLVHRLAATAAPVEPGRADDHP